MGGVGACYDHAMIESFWARMQTELLDGIAGETRIELANALLAGIGQQRAQVGPDQLVQLPGGGVAGGAALPYARRSRRSWRVLRAAPC